MSDPFAGVEPMVYPSRINVPYHWWAGETAGTFLKTLRDRKIILGARCSTCGRVYVPPRRTCPRCCDGAPTEWVELGGQGTLTAVTVVRRQLAALPEPAPAVFGLIRLDGADTALLHRIKGPRAEKAAIGLRVRAVFAEAPTATIRAIDHFEIVNLE
jgi:uncharacterized OB-fold protein